MKRLTMWGALVVLSACTSQTPSDPELASQVSEVVAPVERYIVNFKPGADRDRIIAGVGGSKVMDVFGMNASAAMLPAHAVDALSKNPNVEYVEQDAKRYLQAQSTPYGIDMVQAPLVWPSATGANRQVCIIDSGLYTGHEDHQSGKAISGYPAGWNTDKCHHGTHVAGTIAAVNNTVGVVGVLPNGVNLQIVKVFTDDCSWSYASGLSDAINRCVSGGSNVISMSLGGSLKSRTEQTAVTNAWNSGLIIVAAAGNDGSTKLSYPASYTNVVSVAAVDSTKTVASFSQHNAYVDIAAPGVGVLSTVGAVDTDTITVNGATYSGGHIDLSARTAAGGVIGALANGGLCDTVGAWSGQVVLCQRGTIDFNTKVANVKAGGGIAAVIYNNAPGGFAGTLGTGNSSTIAAISISQEDGQAIINGGGIGLASTVASFVTEPASGYEAYDGTSMATPHVSAVAALVWSYNTSWTNTRVVNALLNSAQDLGAAGRDDYYGYGLVQAQAALNYAIAHP